MIINYEYKGETFKLDDSNGCYVEATYKGLKGYFGVNIGGTGTETEPYVYCVGGEEYVTRDGMTGGDYHSPSFKDARDNTCNSLLNKFSAQEAAFLFREKYCKELHDAVKNQP